MKNRKYVVLVMILLAFTACRESSSSDTPGDNANGTTSSDTVTSAANKSAANNIVTYSQGDMDQAGFMNQDMSQTYSELEMSDEQIQSYESSLDGKQTCEINDDNGDHRDNAMKAILTDVQYDKYEMMKKDTPKNDKQ
ncbi:hypothetical protein [Flavimarina sp. Hel_I_48]|uniref:hypothetical protein n=1 Tax=Flavimarina sp. Hel_I_48 TaxID=1392488 RepID=UPI0004DFC862|nr:hypothetical protein [Flavimarina sp. Hel_I_48]